MKSVEAFNTIVDSIYDAALDERTWPDVLSAVASATNGFCASLVTIDVNRKNIPTSIDFGWPEGFFADYALNYAHLDPRMTAFLAKPEIDIYTDALLVSEEVRLKDPVYEMGRRMSGQHYSYGARLFSASDFESTLIMGRSKSQGEASTGDVESLRRFLPHIRRSVAIARKVGERVSASALDALSMGILILDQYSHVALCNRAMLKLAAAKDGLTVTRTGLHCSDPDDDAAFQRALGFIHRQQYVQASNERTVLSAHRPSGRRPYGIIISPSRRSDVLSLHTQPSVTVCVSDPNTTAHLNEDILSALFGLSSAEARLVTALIGLGSLSAAAADCNLTEGSARQYLKRIFSKTGARGQVDLVALIMATVPV